MKRLAPLFLFGLLGWLVFGRNAQATTTQLTFSQPAPIHVGSSFEIIVNAAQLPSAASGFEWEVTFDPAVLALHNVAIGDGLSATGREAVCPAPLVVSSGRVRVACATTGENGGMSADGVLAILTFEALSVGASNLSLDDIQLVDDGVVPVIFGAGVSADTVIVEQIPTAVGLRTIDSNQPNPLFPLFLFLFSLSFLTYHLRRKSKLTNLQTFIHLVLIFTLTTQTFWTVRAQEPSSSEELGSLTDRRTITQRSPLSNFATDLNGDQLVDANDLTQIAETWQCASGDGCYSADFDFNSDNLIDLFDLASVGNEYDVAPPVITIDAPTENAILMGNSVTVSGTFADKHAVTEILVNGNAATIGAGTFTIDLPTTDGTFPIHVAAVDEIGQTTGATRLVTVDGAGPFITVNLPRNRQAIYTTRPEFDIDYTDLVGTVAVNTLDATLTDEAGSVTNITGDLTANADNAIGTLTFDLTEDETYTLTINVEDTDGIVGTRTSTFYVPPNANSITPPTWSDGAGFVSGYVFDSTTCGGEQQYDPIDCTGIAGATVTLEKIDASRLANARDARQAELIASRSPHGLPHDASRAPEQFRQAVVGTVVTGPGGFFAFPVDETGNYSVRVEKDGFTYGQRLTDIVLEKSAPTADVFLTPLDPAVTPCDSAGCAHMSSDGQMQLSVPAGALTGTQQIDIRATQFDQVQFLPSGELPPGTGETYAFNLSGASEITFTQPITVMLKNDRGFAPGSEIPLGYWNQTLQVWEDAGDVYVDETGEWLVMQVTHFSNFDPNSPVTANTVEVVAIDETKKSGENCATDCDSSEIDIATGILKQEFMLPTVNVLGNPMGVTLNYDSQRANPNAVIDIELGMQELVAGAAQQVDGVLQAELFIEGESTDQFSFELGELEQDGEIGRFRYFWDGRDSQGQQVPPGVYTYLVRVKVPFRAQFFGTTNGLFGGPPDPTQPLGVFTTSTVDRFVSGSVLIGSNATNPYGTGWQVADVQRLHQAEDGSILIDDGDHTLTEYLFPFNDLTDDTPQVRTFGAEQVSVNSEQLAVYSGRLTVNSEPSSTDHAPRTTHHAPRSAATTIITSDILTDTIWTVANSPYLVENDITIAATATLTIEAGVEVRVDAISTVPDNIFVDGTLVTQGTEGNGVLFTDDGFRWGAIVVQGGSAELIHTRIEGSGQSGDGFDGRDAGLVVISGTLTMSNSVIFDSGNTTNRVDGCLIVQDSAVTLVDSVFEECGSPGSFGRAAVAFFGANTTVQATNVLITDSHTFPLAYDLNTITALPDITTDDPRALIFGNSVTNDTTIVPTSNTNQFLVNGDLTIEASAALTLTEGTRWTFRNNTDDLIVNGDLALRGSQNAPIIVTSDEDDDFGQWGGIIVDGGSAEIDFATIRSGGRAIFGASRSGLVGVINGGDLALTNSTLFRISDFSNAPDSYVYVNDSTAVVQGSILSDDGANLANPAFGLHVEDTGATDLTFDNNVVVHRSSLVRIPNQLLDRIGQNNLFSIDNNQRIQIEGGTVTQLAIEPIGNLNAIEYVTDLTVTEAMTVAEGVRLWNDSRQLTLDGGRLVARGSAENPISFEAIDASGSRGIRLINGANADLDFVTVKEAQFGIAVLSDSGLTLKNSIITNNAFGILADDTVSEFSVLLNEISGNTTRGLQNQTSPTQLLDARFNFWGSTTGPTHASNPSGTGDAVGGSVLVVPFLRGTVEGGGNAINLSDFDTTVLTRDPDTGEFIRIYPGGRTVIFNADGFQTVDRDTTGNETRYTYNPNGSLATISYAASGRANPDWIWTLDYDAPRNTQYAIRITDPANRTTTFTIDKNGNLIKWQEPGLSAPMTFAYGATHNMTHKTDARGFTTTYEYDENGRMVRSKLPPREVFDPVTGQFSIGQEIHDFVPTDQADVVNGLDAGSPAEPNAALAKSADFNAQQTINGRAFTHTTNEFGAHTGFLDPLGQQTAIERDERDRIIKMTTPLGNCTTFTYDDFDNLLTQTQMDAAACAGGAGLVKVTTMTYEPRFNQIRSMTDPNGNVTTFEYDYELDLGEAGLLVRKTLPAVNDGTGNVVNPVETYSYNEFGQLVELVAPLGNKMCHVYTTGSVDEASNAATPLFAAGVTPVPGLLTQEIEDCGGALERTTTYREFGADGQPQAVDQPAAASARSTSRTTTFQYDGRGRLIEAVDPLGGVTQRSYDNGDNIIVEVMDAAVRPITATQTYDPINQPLIQTMSGEGEQITTRLAYDLNRQIVLMQDGNGNVTTTQYDALLRPTVITDPFGNTVQMVYDADDRLVQQTDERGVVTTFAYDGLNRLISETLDPVGLNYVRAFTYDLNDNRLTTTQRNGAVSCTTFDALNRPIITAEDCNGINAITQHIFDLNSNYIRAVDPRGFALEWTYDTLDREIAETDPLGGVVQTAYDSADNITTVTDELGRTTSYTYDLRDRMTSVTDALNQTAQYTFDSRNNVATTSDPLGRTMTYGYDVFGRQTQLTDALGHVSQRVYDDNGNQVMVIDALGRTATFQYDALNRLTSSSDALGRVSQVGYDAVGNQTTTLDALGFTVTKSYDNANLLTSVTDQAGDVTLLTFDSMGNQTSVTDPLGNVTAALFDLLNRRTSITDPNGDTTTFGYDSADLLVSTTDALGNTTTYTYDALRRQTAVTNALNDTRTTVYDAVDNPIRIIDRNGRERQFSYDALNRVVLETWVGDGYVAQYDFDAAGQMVRAVDPVAEIVMKYDQTGLLTRSAENITNPDRADTTYQYIYDALGNVTRHFEVVNGQHSSTTTTVYNAVDLPIQISESGDIAKTVNMSYDALNRPVAISRNAAVNSSFSYDAKGRVTTLTHQPTNGAALQYTYQYDTADRLTTLASPSGSSSYSYDGFDQLLGATHDFQANEAYSYDATGNRNNDSEVIGTANRLLENSVFTYEYDGEGNRTLRTNKVTGESAEYSYDFRNRLTNVTLKDSGDNVLEVVSYAYNIFDHRIERSDGDGTQQFSTRGGLVEMAFDGDGNLTNRYLHSMYVDDVLADEQLADASRASTLLFPLADHQWTARDFVDDAGNIVKQRRYDSYGNLTSDSAPTLDYLFDYTGREFDAAADLHYYRARYYDAGIGRFISEDPIGLLAGDNNLQRYVGNSPSLSTDPSGLTDVADDFADFFNFLDEVPANNQVAGVTQQAAEQAADAAKIASEFDAAKRNTAELVAERLRKFIPDVSADDILNNTRKAGEAFLKEDAVTKQIAEEAARRRAERELREQAIKKRFGQASKFSKVLRAVNIFGWAADYGAMVIHVMGDLHVAQLELGRAEMEAKWKKEIQDRKNELYMQGVRERLKKRLAEEKKNNEDRRKANQANRAGEEAFDNQINNFIRGKQGKKGLFGDMQNNFNVAESDKSGVIAAQQAAAKRKGGGGPQQVTPDAGNNPQEDSASRALFNFFIQESKKRQQAQQNAGGNGNNADNCVPPNGK